MRISESAKGKRFDVRLTPNSPNVVFVGAIDLLRDKPITRTLLAILGVFLALGGGYLFMLWNQLNSEGNIRFSPTTVFVTAFLGFALCLAAVLSGPKFNVVLGGPIEADARRDAELAIGPLSKDPYATLELDSKRLSEYYAINQSQARSSFRWALVAMFGGLATIVAGFWFYYLRDGARDTMLTALATGSGGLVSAISGMYLYLHNQTQRHSLYYYGQLVRLQQLGLAIRLAESHEDVLSRTAAKDIVIREILRSAGESAVQDVRSASSEAKSE